MYTGTFEIYKRLFSAYGGIKALIRSPYVHVAIIICITSQLLSTYKIVNDVSLDVLPSLLGFSIASYAIVFGVMGDTVLDVISKKEEGDKFSDLTVLSASFAWFVLIQSFALIMGITIKVFDIDRLHLIGLKENIIDCMIYLLVIYNIIFQFLFYYAMCLAVAIVVEIFRISTFREN